MEKVNVGNLITYLTMQSSKDKESQNASMEIWIQIMEGRLDKELDFVDVIFDNDKVMSVFRYGEKIYQR